MKTRHSAGPWTIDGGGRVVAANTIVIVVSPGGMTKNERTANAQLIAGAPDAYTLLAKTRHLLDVGHVLRGVTDLDQFAGLHNEIDAWFTAVERRSD